MFAGAIFAMFKERLISSEIIIYQHALRRSFGFADSCERRAAFISTVVEWGAG
jgi:hypothetical protein